MMPVQHPGHEDHQQQVYRCKMQASQPLHHTDGRDLPRPRVPLLPQLCSRFRQRNAIRLTSQGVPEKGDIQRHAHRCGYVQSFRNPLLPVQAGLFPSDQRDLSYTLKLHTQQVHGRDQPPHWPLMDHTGLYGLLNRRNGRSSCFW